MDFSEALLRLKKGKQVCRSGWNGKEMFISLAYPDYEDKREPATIHFNISYPGVSTMLDNFICMKTADDKLVPWLASQTDILAEDWEVVE